MYHPPAGVAERVVELFHEEGVWCARLVDGRLIFGRTYDELRERLERWA